MRDRLHLRLASSAGLRIILVLLAIASLGGCNEYKHNMYNWTGYPSQPPRDLADRGIRKITVYFRAQDMGKARMPGSAGSSMGKYIAAYVIQTLEEKGYEAQFQKMNKLPASDKAALTVLKKSSAVDGSGAVMFVNCDVWNSEHWNVKCIFVDAKEQEVLYGQEVAYRTPEQKLTSYEPDAIISVRGAGALEQSTSEPLLLPGLTAEKKPGVQLFHHGVPVETIWVINRNSLPESIRNEVGSVQVMCGVTVGGKQRTEAVVELWDQVIGSWFDWLPPVEASSP